MHSIYTVAPAINDELAFLISIVQNQQAAIQNQHTQMELLTDRIVAIKSTTIIAEEEEEYTIDNGVGSTYVRWRRTVCPDGVQLVYEGNCMLLMYNKTNIKTAS